MTYLPCFRWWRVKEVILINGLQCRNFQVLPFFCRIHVGLTKARCVGTMLIFFSGFDVLDILQEIAWMAKMMLEEGRPCGPRQLKPPWLVVDTKMMVVVVEVCGGHGQDRFHSPLQRGLTLTIN